MAITRRQFLKRSGRVAAGALLGPGLFGNPFVRRALAEHDRRSLPRRALPRRRQRRAQHRHPRRRRRRDAAHRLRGRAHRPAAAGCSITPADARRDARSASTRTPARSSRSIPGSGLGAACKALYDAGKRRRHPGLRLSRLQPLARGVARSIWETGDSALGRAYAAPAGSGATSPANYGGTRHPGASTSTIGVAGEFRQSDDQRARRPAARATSASRTTTYSDDDIAAKRAAFDGALRRGRRAGAADRCDYLGNSGARRCSRARATRALHDLYVSDRADASNDAVRRPRPQHRARSARDREDDLRRAAGRRPTSTRASSSSNNGGYDTHSDQGGAETDGQHYDLHAEVGDALEALLRRLRRHGRRRQGRASWSGASSAAASRRTSNGTDHGSQGPMFVIGGERQRRRLRQPPEHRRRRARRRRQHRLLAGRRDPFRSTDFRDVYGTILKHWLNVPSRRS